MVLVFEDSTGGNDGGSSILPYDRVLHPLPVKVGGAVDNFPRHIFRGAVEASPVRIKGNIPVSPAFFKCDKLRGGFPAPVFVWCFHCVFGAGVSVEKNT